MDKEEIYLEPDINDFDLKKLNTSIFFKKNTLYQDPNEIKKQKSKKNKCNIKNVICLNDKKQQSSFIRNVKTVMKKKEVSLRNAYSFYYNKKDKENSFNVSIIRKNNTLYLKISDGQGWDDKVRCLDMIFKKYNEKKGSFEQSKIVLINRGKCGLKGNKLLEGSYILNLANKFNEILNVKVSILQDDSKLDIKCGNISSTMSLKMINLLKYGKTWYEREGGFKMDNKKLYLLTYFVQDIKVSDIIQFISNKSNRDLGEFEIKDKDIEKLEKVLLKLGVTKNIKLKNLYRKAFIRKSPLNDCDQYWLYQMTLSLPRRKIVEQQKDKESKMYKKLQEFSELHSHFTNSSNKKNKIKKIIEFFIKKN